MTVFPIHNFFTVIFCSLFYFTLQGMSSDDSDSQELVKPAFPNCSDALSGGDALIQFRKTVNTEEPRQLFRVCRIDGIADMRRDIMGIYKNPNTRLKATPRVRFEEEDGVGSGPVREFLTCAVKLVDEGIPSLSGKSLVFFEGQANHRIPVHDQSLRLTGAFLSVGRIIAHSILHGGPGLHGLSPAVKQYLSSQKESDEPLAMSISDIADLDLRELVVQVYI